MTTQPLVIPDIVPVQKRSVRRNRCVFPVACVCACMVVFNVAVSLLLIQWQQSVTVTFDMKSTVDRFMEQTALHQLSEAQSAALSGRFTQALERSLADYQHRYQALILVSPSVVSGARDITAAVQQDVSHRMQEGVR